MDATKNVAVVLDPMANHFAAAMLALGRKGVDRTLKRIECVPLSGHGDRKRFVVIVAANFTLRHCNHSSCCLRHVPRGTMPEDNAHWSTGTRSLANDSEF
jgi:hypothetical protein